MYKEHEIYRLEMINFIKNRYTLDGEVQSEIPNLDFIFFQTP